MRCRYSSPRPQRTPRPPRLNLCRCGPIAYGSRSGPQQQTKPLLDRGGGFGTQFIIGRAAHGVRNDHERIAWHTQYARHQLGGTDEPFGHHGDRGNSKTFGCHGVMQTARRATASVADPADDGIPLSDLGGDMRIGRRAEVRFHSGNDVGDAKLRPQHAIEMGEEGFRAFLAVRDDADRFARQCREPWRRMAGGGGYGTA